MELLLLFASHKMRPPKWKKCPFLLTNWHVFLRNTPYRTCGWAPLGWLAPVIWHWEVGWWCLVAAYRLKNWVWWSGHLLLIRLDGLGMTSRIWDNILRRWHSWGQAMRNSCLIWLWTSRWTWMGSQRPSGNIWWDIRCLGGLGGWDLQDQASIQLGSMGDLGRGQKTSKSWCQWVHATLWGG